MGTSEHLVKPERTLRGDGLHVASRPWEVEVLLHLLSFRPTETVFVRHSVLKTWPSYNIQA